MVRATVPVKPLTGATVTVEAIVVPATVITEDGLVLRLKSVTVNTTVN